MIEHKDTDAKVPVNGRPALPEAKEMKELPPASGNGEGGREFRVVDPPSARRRSRAWIWLLVLAVAGFIGYRAYENVQKKNAAAAAAQERRAANRAVPVAAVPVRRGDLPIYLRGLGTADAYNTVNVRTRVDGPITAVLFKEGQNVTKGQPLVEIDPRTFQATVNQAEGQLARDEAQLRDAQTNQARYQALWQAGVIAKQQLDTQTAQVGQFQGVIEADRAAIENARLQLQFTHIVSPITGRIGLRQVDIGNIVHASDQTPIAVITQMQPIAVLFTIPADDLPQVLRKLHAGATLRVDAYDRADRNLIASGTLETVDNQIDPNTGTSRLKAVFPNEDNVLFPQQFVNARLLLETRRGVLLIPAPAVQRGPQGSYVYVVNGQTANMRPVTVGVSEGSDVEVTSGLAPGDVVVVDGQDKLQEGSKVEVRPENSDGTQGGATGGRRSGNRTGQVPQQRPSGGNLPPATQTNGGNRANPGGGQGPNRTGTPDASGVPAGRPVQGGRSR